MRLIIFGSTGSVGRLVVEQALQQGHAVTAFARNPEKLDIKHENLKVFQGDVFDSDAVEKAVQDQDVVLCILGAGEKGVVRSEGTKNIVRAMEKAGVRRFICQSAIAVGDSWNNLNPHWKEIFKTALREAYEDHESQEKHVTQSNLDWTIVRAAPFTDGERTGTYRHGFPTSDTSLTLEISRADVADFLLKQVTDDSYLCKTPGLSY